MVAMARMVVAGASLPITVKTRIGLGPESDMPIVDLARRLEDAGVAALTIHCRTAQMGHSGAADWRWASVHAHLGLIADDGVTAAAPVLARVPDLADRIADGEDEVLSTRLRKAERIGRPVGGIEFLTRLEQQSGRRLIPAKRGPRPKMAAGRE